MDSLNSQQKKAVTTLEGPVIVIAGAGTGKTRVLEYRTLQLINAGIAPKSILLLTFTRRAASEMLIRAGRHDPKARDVSGGTFHSFALGVLQRYGKTIGLDQFTVIDRGDMEDVTGKVISDLLLKDKKYFPKKHTVTDIISKSVNKMLPIGTVLETDYPHLFEWKDAIELIHTKIRAYKQKRNLVDFDDLLAMFLDLLEMHPSISERLRKQYQYIMVDEYQDTNKIQDMMMRKLSGKNGNILVVGDEMQSIYRFRGAEFTNMLHFPKRFTQVKQIPLDENYRSTQEILSVANNILDHVEGERFSKHLSSDRNGAMPKYAQFKSIQQEAEWIVTSILELFQQGYRMRDIAILFRAAYQSAPLEIALASMKIPFKKFGGIRFVEAAHIKDVLAHLRVIVNPNDELSWRRIILLREGVGEKSADMIINKLNSANLKDSTLLRITGDDRLGELSILLQKINNSALSPSQKLSEIVSYYKPILRRQYDDYPQREPDLDALIEIAFPYKDDSSLLSDFALDPPEKSAVEMLRGDHDFVTLSTVHSAKGLEWRAVFIIQAVDGKFPIIRPESKKEDIEEERRLFYVAVTRAKDSLFISSSHGRSPGYYDSWFFTKPSRFVEPILEAKLVDSYLIERSDPYERFRKNIVSSDTLIEQDVDEF